MPFYYKDPSENPFDLGTEKADEWEDNNTVTLESLVIDVTELAFGDNAVERGYGIGDALDKLKEFSDKALAFDESGLDVNDNLDPDGRK